MSSFLNLKRIFFTEYKIKTRSEFVVCYFTDDNCILYHDKYIMGKLMGIIWIPVKNYLTKTRYIRDDK